MVYKQFMDTVPSEPAQDTLLGKHNTSTSHAYLNSELGQTFVVLVDLGIILIWMARSHETSPSAAAIITAGDVQNDNTTVTMMRRR